MSFVKSLINQVGRDAGRVVSNQIFKDAHSTPYRRVGGTYRTHSDSNNQQNYIPEYQTAYNDLKNSLTFETSHRPSTLINKLAGAYTILKNNSKSFIEDEYLDVDESDALFSMVQEFANKAGDIDDVLDLDAESNSKELTQLQVLVEKANDVFIMTLERSIVGCENQAKQWRKKGEEMEFMNFFKWVLLHFFFMGTYARTGKKNWGATIIANIFSFLFFGIINFIFALAGMLNYLSYRNKFNQQKERCFRLSDLELERAKIYKEYLNTNSK